MMNPGFPIEMDPNRFASEYFPRQEDMLLRITPMAKRMRKPFSQFSSHEFVAAAIVRHLPKIFSG